MNTNKQVSSMLKNAPPGMTDIDECIDFLIAMSPIDEDPVFFSGTERHEYKAWLEDIREMHLKTILEIGTYRGRTTWLLSRACPSDTLIVTVEIKDGAPWVDIEQMGLPGQEIISLVGDSRDESTLHVVETILEGEQVDLLFIDSDHSYETTAREVALYSPLVKDGGSVGLHDMLNDQWVAAVWKEVIEKHPDCKVYNSGQYGIGMTVVHR